MKKTTDPCEYEEGMCGVPGFHTTKDDPFYACCKIHDAAYDVVHPGQSTKEIDQELLACCLDVAKTDPLLKLRAKAYYKAARRYGWLREILGKWGLWRLGRAIGKRL